MVPLFTISYDSVRGARNLTHVQYPIFELIQIKKKYHVNPLTSSFTSLAH